MKNHSSVSPRHRPKSTMWNRLAMILAVMSVIDSSNKCVVAKTTTTAKKSFSAAVSLNKHTQAFIEKDQLEVRELAQINGACKDHPNFTFQIVNGAQVPCSWLTAPDNEHVVKARRAKWCDGSPSVINNGLVIANRCQASCGQCNAGPCKDNEKFTFQVGNDSRSVGCDWITASPASSANRIAKRCNKNIPQKYVGNHCRETCGLCNDIPPPVLPPGPSIPSGNDLRVGTVDTSNVDGNGWIDISKIDALSSLSGSNEGDQCGAALDISQSGKYLIVGCPGTLDGAGSVRLLEFTTSGWSSRNIDSAAAGIVSGPAYGQAVSIVENVNENAIYFSIASDDKIQVWHMPETFPTPIMVGSAIDRADVSFNFRMQLTAGGKILTFIEETVRGREVTFNQKRLLGSSIVDFEWVDDIEPFTENDRLNFKVTADGKQLAIQTRGFEMFELSGKMDSREKRTREELIFSNLPARPFTSFDLSDDGKIVAFGDIFADSDGMRSNGEVHVFNILETNASGLKLEPVSPKRITGETNIDFCGEFVKVFNEDRISVIYTCDDSLNIFQRAILIGDEVTTWRKDQLSTSEDFEEWAFSSNALRFALGNPSEDENTGVVKVFQDKIQTPSDVVLLNDDWREITTGEGIFGTEALDTCGAGLDMSKSGRFVLVGCPEFLTTGASGSVHLFEFKSIGGVLTWLQRDLGIAQSLEETNRYGRKVSMVENNAEDNLYFAVRSTDADSNLERIDVWRMPMNSFGIKRVGEPIIIERTELRPISDLELSAGGRILTFSLNTLFDGISIERRKLVGNCNTLCEWRDDMNQIETNMQRASFSVSASGKRLAHLSSEGLKLLQFDENEDSTSLFDETVANMFGGIIISSISLADDGKTIALGEAVFSSGGETQKGRVRVFNVIKSGTTGKVGLEEVGPTITGGEGGDRCGANVKVFNENHMTVYYSCDQDGSDSTIIKRATLTDGLTSVWSIQEFVIPKPSTTANRDFIVEGKRVSFAANAFRLAIENGVEDVDGNLNAGRVRVFQNDKLAVEPPVNIISAPTKSPHSKGGKGSKGKGNSNSPSRSPTEMHWIELNKNAFQGVDKGDQCGQDFDISQDGNFLIMGCTHSDPIFGSLHIFKKGSNWSLLKTINEPEWDLDVKFFGENVAIWENNDPASVRFAHLYHDIIEVWDVTTSTGELNQVGTDILTDDSLISGFGRCLGLELFEGGEKIMYYFEVEDLSTISIKRFDDDGRNWVNDIPDIRRSGVRSVQVALNGSKLVVLSSSEGLEIFDLQTQLQEPLVPEKPSFRFQDHKDFGSLSISEDGEVIAIGKASADYRTRTNSGLVQVLRTANFQKVGGTLYGPDADDFCGDRVQVSNVGNIVTVLFACKQKIYRAVAKTINANGWSMSNPLEIETSDWSEFFATSDAKTVAIGLPSATVNGEKDAGEVKIFKISDKLPVGMPSSSKGGRQGSGSINSSSSNRQSKSPQSAPSRNGLEFAGISSNGIEAGNTSGNNDASVNLVVITTVAALAVAAVVAASLFVYRRSIKNRECVDEPESMVSFPVKAPMIAAGDGTIEMKLMDGRHY